MLSGLTATGHQIGGSLGLAVLTTIATGSLGQGLPIGVGIALDGKYVDKLPFRTWVVLGDSEMAEGSIWEAFDKASYYKLNNLIAKLTDRENTLTLDDLRVANTDHLRGGGAFNFKNNQWWLWLDTRELELPGWRKPVSISFNTSGDKDRIDLTQFYYKSGKFEASASGSYVYSLPKPLDIYFDLWRIPVAYANDPAVFGDPVPADRESSSSSRVCSARGEPLPWAVTS